MAEYEPAFEALKRLSTSADVDNDAAAYLDYFMREYTPGEYNWPGWMQSLMLLHYMPRDWLVDNVALHIPFVLYEARAHFDAFRMYIPPGQENEFVSPAEPSLGTWSEFSESFKLGLRDQIELLDSWIVDDIDI